MGLFGKAKGFMFSPSESFEKVKGEGLGEGFKYFLVLLLIFSVILSVLALVAFTAVAGFLGIIFGAISPGIAETLLALGAGIGALFAGLLFVLLLVVGIIGIFIGGLWLHLWVYIVGGRKGVTQTIKTAMYGSTPSLLLGWIPFVGIITGIWALIVQIIGIRQLHTISTGRAFLAWLLSAIIPIVVFALISMV